MGFYVQRHEQIKPETPVTAAEIKEALKQELIEIAAEQAIEKARQQSKGSAQ